MTPGNFVRSPALMDLHSSTIEGSFTPSPKSAHAIKIQWRQWLIQDLSTAISRRYCSDGSELRMLEVMRNALQDVERAENDKEAQDYANYAIGNH